MAGSKLSKKNSLQVFPQPALGVHPTKDSAAVYSLFQIFIRSQLYSFLT